MRVSHITRLGTFSRRATCGGSRRPFSSQSSEENTSKDVGNPITWANPTGGPSMQDKSPKYWRYIYPTGAALIIFGFYLAGRKNDAKKTTPAASPRAKAPVGSFELPPSLSQPSKTIDSY